MATKAGARKPAPYTMRISRLTVDKLGVKLYDKVSAVVAELVANSYDADATKVNVQLPLGTELASKNAAVGDKGYEIVVTDNGHGMKPKEAQDLFLWVGTDRRQRPKDGSRSRRFKRRVMGRKGIGKLAPFGICRCIEVISSGGEKTAKGYLTSHFLMDFEKIVADEDTPVPLDAGSRDRTYSRTRGTTVRLTHFLPKRVPTEKVFIRQLARRFSLTDEKFQVQITDSGSGEVISMPKFQIPLNEATKVDVSSRPVKGADGAAIPELALARPEFGLSRSEENANAEGRFRADNRVLHGVW